MNIAADSSEPHYLPTESDLLWLARAVAGEGAPEALVAQALVNRFLWLRWVRNVSTWATLADFVQAYAQPVNPRWMRGGDKWQAAWERVDAAGRRRLEAAHRRRQAHRERASFRPGVWSASLAALGLREAAAPLPTPATTDYAAHTLAPPSHLRLTRAGRPGVNAFYEPKSPGSWLGYRWQFIECVADAQPGRLSDRPLFAYAHALVPRLELGVCSEDA